MPLEGHAPGTAAPTPASTAPTSATSAPPETISRNDATLKSALLVVGELPVGFDIDPAAVLPDAVMFSSTDPQCGDLVARLSHPSPGYSAWAGIAFSAGQSGPLGTETLAAVGSVDGVAKALAKFKESIVKCPNISLSPEGGGSFTMAVRPLSPPITGTGPVGLRLLPADPTRSRVDFSWVQTGVGDSVLQMTFIGVSPSEMDRLMHLATDKASKGLGVSGPAAGV